MFHSLFYTQLLSLSYFEPLEMKETFAERMFEQVVVSDLDEVDKHRTFTTSLKF